MDDDLDIDDFKRWKVEPLRDFLRKRGIQHSSKRKEELVALVYAAYKDKKPTLLSPAESTKLKAEDYQSLLLCGPHGRIPDPFSDIVDGWVSEEKGVGQWPPTMQMDIADYLLTHVKDRDLSKRLMTDYKEGKAYSYFDSKWLGKVWYHNISDHSKICLLKSESTHSERIKNIPHKMWVVIEKKTGSVASAYCTCFAGLGSTCNHVAAILFKVEFAWHQGWTNQACTSRPCEWNQYGKNKTIEPKRISEMQWRKPHHRKQGKKTVINPATRQLFSPQTKSPAKIDSIVSALFTSCPQASAFQYISVIPEMTYPPEEDFNVSRIVEVSTSVQVPLCIPDMASNQTSVQTFLSELPKFTAAIVDEVEKVTRFQSESEEWKKQRLGRITSSTAHRVMTKVNSIISTTCNFKSLHDTTSLIKQIMGYSSPPEYIPALKYGKTMEKEARNNYKSMLVSSGHSRVRVIESGLCVFPEKIYIAASPDGFVECNCCGHGLVEIKCPLSVAHEKPTNLNLAYIYVNNGNYSLKKTHSYYTQIQCQLGVTGRKWCDFFVYTRHGYISVRVGFDEERWVKILNTAEYFFKNHLASELINKTLTAASEATSSTSISCDITSSQQFPIQTVVANTNTSTARGKGKVKRAKHAFSPLYCCQTCGNVCKETPDISDNDDFSVQCDNDNCKLWYHWDCVDFQDFHEAEAEKWLCPLCFP